MFFFRNLKKQRNVVWNSAAHSRFHWNAKSFSTLILLKQISIFFFLTLIKALRKTEISELFVFCEFQKIFRKKLVFSNSWKFCEKSLEKSLEIISCFWVKKFRKAQKKFGNRGFWKFQTCKNFRICSITNFPKITKKNDSQLELQKSQKTCSDLKTDANVWFKVRNAGP